MEQNAQEKGKVSRLFCIHKLAFDTYIHTYLIILEVKRLYRILKQSTTR